VHEQAKHTLQRITTLLEKCLVPFSITLLALGCLAMVVALLLVLAVDHSFYDWILDLGIGGFFIALTGAILHPDT
jgi:hypothetical protein